MARRERTESVGDSMCSVCHDRMDIYAIGACDHPICYRCSTRMRVLCSQMYCPICRGDLPQVVFLTEKKKYDSVDRRQCIPNRQYKILFENEEIEEAYNVLLENRCRICDQGPLFDTFHQLETHMKRLHCMFACDLCVSHLKIFPFERKFYNRKDLAVHRKSGDSDNTSYRGHPLCRFCDDRYMDNDELLRHLRKDHFYCQFCDAFNSNEYYNDYEDLKAHFRAKHFLCEEGLCASPDARFTHAFSSEIDLKAHKTSEHMGNRSKAEAKELRTIDLHFQVAPRRRGRDNSIITPEDFEEVSASAGRNVRRTGGYKRNDPQQDVPERPVSQMTLKESSNMVEPPRVPVLEDDFPSLSGALPVPVYHPPTKERAPPQEDFPSLTQQRHSPPIVLHTPVPHRQVQKKPTVNFSRVAANVTCITDPAVVGKMGEGLPVASKPAPPPNAGPRQKWSAPLLSSGEDFPSLGADRSEKSLTNGRNFVSLGAWSKNKKDGQKKDGFKTMTIKASVQQAGERSSGRPAVAFFNKVLGDDREFPSLGGAPTLKSVSAVLEEETLHGGCKKNDLSLKSGPSFPSKQINSTIVSGSTEEKPHGSIKKSGLSSNFGPSLPSKQINGTNVSGSTEERSHGSSKKSDLSSNSGLSLPSKQVNGTKDRGSAEEKPGVGGKKSDMSSRSDPSLLSKPGNGTKDCGNTESKSKKKKKKQKSKDDVVESACAEQVSEEETLDSRTECSKSPQKTIEVNCGQVNRYISDTAFPQSQESVSTFVEQPVLVLEKLNMLEDKENQAIFSKAELFVDDDFPSLQSVSKKTDPPPGFRKEENFAKPPPGLKKPLSQARAPPGLAPAISSSSTCIPMSVKLNMYSFVPPSDMAERNSQLFTKLQQMLNPADLDMFRRLSGEFRSCQMGAMEYLKQCQELFRKEQFLFILPELLALLPDILKQQELFVACKHSTVASELNSQLLSCPVCHQVLVVKDYSPHMISHPSFGADALSASIPQSATSKLTLAT